MDSITFLTQFSSYLEKNNWGDIDPRYFKPIEKDEDIIDSDHVELQLYIIKIFKNN